MAISAGIYSLVGVVIGGGVTWFSQRSQALRAELLDTRLARRQVQKELELAEARVRAMVESPTPIEERQDDSKDILRQISEHPEWARHSDRLDRHLLSGIGKPSAELTCLSTFWRNYRRHPRSA
jgi:hypothetical protein